MTFTQRRLRAQSVRARRMHRCDVCGEFIFPGDIYYLIVEVRKTGPYSYLWVKKEHESPCCPFPYDDRDNEELKFLQPYQLPLAA